MITFQEFLNKHNGRYIDYDHVYGYQCVDLMRQYIQEVWDLSPYKYLPGAPGARQIYQRYTGNFPFIKINNTKWNVPSAGDIIFWGWYWGVTGANGHVGIIVGDGSNVKNFISFDQNWPTNSACHRQLHDYRGVMGWLRKV